jgi:hypothetical protein
MRNNDNEVFIAKVGLVIAFLSLLFTVFGPLPPQWSPYGQDEISIRFAAVPRLIVKNSSLNNAEDINSTARLGLHYNDEPVNQPYSIRYKIQNSGSKPIGKDNYYKHITLDFSPSHKILNAYPTSTKKNKLLEKYLQYQKDSSLIDLIHEEVFYPGDFFEFDIIVDSISGDSLEPKIPKPKAGINGANSGEMIQFFPGRGKIIRLFTFIVSVCVIVGCIFYIVGSTLVSLKTIYPLIAFTLMIFVLLFAL